MSGCFRIHDFLSCVLESSRNAYDGSNSILWLGAETMKLAQYTGKGNWLRDRELAVRNCWTIGGGGSVGWKSWKAESIGAPSINTNRSAVNWKVTFPAVKEFSVRSPVIWKRRKRELASFWSHYLIEKKEGCVIGFTPENITIW